MPKKVFYLLSTDKQNQLIEASYKVFGENTYFGTSINQLTEALNITRTAFYYYFYNKEDLYDYLVSLQKDCFINNYIYDKNRKLDLEEIFILLFDFLSTFKNTQMKNFFLDLFFNISYDRQEELLEKLNNENFSHFIGFDEYNVETKEEAMEIVYIMFSIVGREIFNYYQTSISLEDAKASLIRKIDLIKYGIDKGEQNEEPKYRYSN